MIDLRNKEEIDDFLKTVEECKGDVILSSIYGDKYNLKSVLSRYVGLGALIKDNGESLELFASNKDDEAKLLNFLYRLHKDR